MRPTAAGEKWRNWRSAAEWKVEARTPQTPTAPSMQRVSKTRFAPGAPGSRTLLAQLRDDPQRVALLDEPLELGERLLQPGRVDLRPGRAHDLRVRGRSDRLAIVPEHL